MKTINKLYNQVLNYLTNFNNGIEITLNNGKYFIKSEVLLTKGQTTIVINSEKTSLWISILLTPLEKKFFSFKQLNFNYNSYIFTRNAEKKSSKESDKDVLISRNVDRSIRPYIPDNFPFNITIESWNLNINDEDPLILLIIGVSCGLLNLGIINHSIMPIVFNDKFNLSAMVYDRKIANLEFNGKNIAIDNIVNTIEKELKNYNMYNQKLIENFNFKNYEVLVNQNPLYQVYSINEVLNAIKEFNINYEDLNNHLEHILNVIIKRIDDKTYDHFLHGQWNSFIHQWILDQLSLENIININFFTEHIFIEVKKKLFCNNLIKNKTRQDNRGFLDSRPITLEPCFLNNFHNSVCLVKGKTRLLIGGYFLSQDKNYDHKIHVKYIFNNFINPKRTSSRREIGHGYLIEKSINKVVGDNPWKAFFNCYITNSDGSSSMLSVIGCGLMIDKFQWHLDKVSGISIGMIEGNKSKKFLVDIAENEDFYCYMDMKVVSTKLGIVSCQLDVKNMGIDINILKESLELAQKKNNMIIKTLYKLPLDEISSSYYNNVNNEVINCHNFEKNT